MDEEDNWAEFGKNLEVVDNFNYFPNEWVFPDKSEYFIDFVNLYKESFGKKNLIKKLGSYDLRDSTNSNSDGIYKTVNGNFFFEGDKNEADFVYMRNGKLIYSQKSFFNYEFFYNVIQTFYGKDSYLQKYYSNHEESGRELPSLVSVLRGKKISWNNKFVARISQSGFGCLDLDFFVSNPENPFISFSMSDLKSVEKYYSKGIQENIKALNDFNFFVSLISNMKKDGVSTRWGNNPDYEFKSFLK